MYYIKSFLPAASALGSKSHASGTGLDTNNTDAHVCYLSNNKATIKKKTQKPKDKLFDSYNNHICHKLWSQHVWSDAISPRKIVPVAVVFGIVCIFSHCNMLHICCQFGEDFGLFVYFFSAANQLKLHKKCLSTLMQHYIADNQEIILFL